MDSMHNAEKVPRYVGLDSKKKDIQRVNRRTPSLKTLIKWNISKAQKNYPGIDLKGALRETEQRLDEVHDAKALVSPDARNLCCALLAWQQLGHRRADSLYNLMPCQWGSPTKMNFSSSFGLVVNLPRDPQMLMYLSNPIIKVPEEKSKRCSCGKPVKKVDTASNIALKGCCPDKKCMERLTKIEAETKELKNRAEQFTHRVRQRGEQLERAEMAWRDLDAGYQRRLRVAKDKEEEYQKQTARVLDERNKIKLACLPLVDALKKKSSVAEKDQETLKQLEKEMCARACGRAQLAENVARVSAQLTEHQCKSSQLDRNLAWKEEHERSQHRALEDAIEVAKVLTHEAECAHRVELEALRGQVAQASQDLLEEDARTALLKKRIEDYMEEKNGMIEDLEGCQTMCENRMGALVKDLRSKKDKLDELKAKVMKCRCKEPVERAVEAKRTPSLAALCKCSPSDTTQGSCSCTSLRSRLLSSLLKNLFNGLKSEMETIGSQMPCNLLKCLEDKHNWDQSTEVKKSVRAYFSGLLLSELDIAIATVIERSHAQWVGESCVDKMRSSVSPVSRHSSRWQEHELQMKTQKLASELAEKMFKERAKELAELAQKELQDSRPPCECDLIDSPQKANSFQESDKSICLCRDTCACLNKTPSTTSIDKIISVLTKWKDNLVGSRDCEIHQHDKNVKSLKDSNNENDCIYPRTKDEISNEDKSVEVQNNSNDVKECVLSPDEPCVCCPITNADNTNDLEVNAFQLLEEHLKSKLDELRRSVSRSSYIPKVDEKSILGDTIVKVKKLITESATKATCKCGRNDQSSCGSWNRAYSLLHEYLKTKIEDVKCICNSVEYRQDENLVTRVLNQISCLIENDLQRLKNICKCNDRTLQTISKRESHITHELQCGINDLYNHDNMIITNSIEKNNMRMTQVMESKYLSYDKGVSLSHNKAAQVLLHHSVDNKSCNALKISSKYSGVQTLDVMKTELVTDNYITSESDDVKPTTNQQDNDSSTKKAEKKSNIYPDIQNNGLTKEPTPFKKKVITVLPLALSSGNNIDENSSKKNNLIDDQLPDAKKLIHVFNEDNNFDEPFFANIGCTINCCCDRDLGCVCTKSTVLSNSQRLRTHDIFKTFTQKQSVVENVSYILKSKPNKMPKNVNSIEDHSEDVDQIEKIKTNNLNQRESNVEGNIYFGRCKQTVHVVNDDYKAELVHESKTIVCESGINTSDHIYLNQSTQRFEIINDYNDSANTIKDESSLQFNYMPPKSKHRGILKRSTHKLFKHVPMCSNSDTVLIADNELQKSEPLSTNCDCAMVPLCHVKMLVENIGNKLIKAECTCDSLKSVCPIHS
ncbi:uncharacterized protein LOC134678116 [Cydia fagiglandana]|uniref:uncharacterized protein LOC134678116 n=1 Tax=Cydia fagiglandana TaxID=1458189 RepID=UPI002FEE5867